MKKPILKTLPNGVRVLMIPQPGAVTATVLVLVGAGSLTESKEEHGLSHFLEHMMFKGTQRFPNAKAIVGNFERIGAVSNAFTASEYTGYYAKGGPSNISIFLDVLSDIYLNSTFPTIEINKERGVIIEEINMYEDMPQQKVAETLISTMFGDQPAGRSIAGTKETVSGFTREDIVAYKKKHYSGDNTLVVVSGDINTEGVYQEVGMRFGTLDSGRVPTAENVVYKDRACACTVVYKDSDQAHIALGMHGVRFGDTDVRAVSLLATILGRGLSSRLTQTLREELGAAYYVSAGNDTHRTHGVFEISAGIDRTRINEILGHIARILKDLTVYLVTDDELHIAREYTLGMLRLGLESSDDLAGFYGVQVMMGEELHTAADLDTLYRQVTPADIRRVARMIFRSDNVSIAVVGPYSAQDIDTKPFLALSETL